jgi:hypothetical protein
VLECRHVLVFGIKEFPARINFSIARRVKRLSWRTLPFSLAIACCVGALPR